MMRPQHSRLPMQLYLAAVNKHGAGGKRFLISCGYSPRLVHRKARSADSRGFTLDGGLTGKGQALLRKGEDDG